jgi:hypothetical protein
MTLAEANSGDGLSVVEELFDVLLEAGFAPKSDANALSPAYVDVYAILDGRDRPYYEHRIAA